MTVLQAIAASSLVFGIYCFIAYPNAIIAAYFNSDGSSIDCEDAEDQN